MTIVKLASNPAVAFVNPFLVSERTEKPKLDLIDRNVYISRDGDIYTAAVVERLKITEPKKVQTVDFFDYYVKIGNRIYEIMVKEEGTVYNVLGISIPKVEKKREFIVVDNKILYIEKEEKTGRKILVG